MDATLLQQATGCSAALAATFAPSISMAMDEFSITTVPRMAAFLAQTAYESELFSVLEENLNYSAQALVATFPSEFDAVTAANYARQPEKIANRAYANRMGNGDEASGDGWLYRGRGLIQLTGKNNYVSLAQALCTTADTTPDMIATPTWAPASAGWFWYSNNLNKLADAELFQAITGRINPGLLGLEARTALYHRALDALNA